ncbi:unnamed protein product [Lampetra fluviatilis]
MATPRPAPIGRRRAATLGESATNRRARICRWAWPRSVTSRAVHLDHSSSSEVDVVDEEEVDVLEEAQRLPIAAAAATGSVVQRILDHPGDDGGGGGGGGGGQPRWTPWWTLSLLLKLLGVEVVQE